MKGNYADKKAGVQSPSFSLSEWFRVHWKQAKAWTLNACWHALRLTLSLLLLAVSSLGQPPVFREVAGETGLRFHHFTGATGELYMPEIMGSGCAWLDYDNDGDLDVYLVQGALLDEKKTMRAASYPPPPSWQPGNQLFRNELIPAGKLRFTDVTVKAGVGHRGVGMGVAAGDLDNDGDVDLYLTNLGANVLYRNNGNGTFTDITKAAGVDDPRWSTSAAWLDYDRDGDLDLFVVNYVDFTPRNHKPCFAPTGEPDYCTPRAYNPLRNRLFRNDGKGAFTDVTQPSGIGSIAGPGLGVQCADFNGDGWLDVYVANDGAANFLWLNKTDGTFEEVGLLAGAAYGMDGIARAGMGATAGDFDNDGDEDIFVTNLTREGSTLYRNDGKGNFQDATLQFALSQPSFLSTGFGVGWFDYDNDGRLDLFAANGAVTMLPTLKGAPYPFQQRNQLFRNEGTSFREVTTGAALQLAEVSRGAAFGDVDNDGDVDVLVSNNNGPARLLLNETSKQQNWLSVRLAGVTDNRQGLGAVVTVFRAGLPPLVRRVQSDGSYLSAHDPRVHFGLGTATAIERVQVRWPSGKLESWTKISLNRAVTLRQQTGSAPDASRQ